MSVFKKLQEGRVRLQSKKMKKTGRNTFAKYDYFELGDFLPLVQQICNEVGICGTVTFDKEYATLTIVDVDDPVQIIQFRSPMAEADLKGCHPIQSLGAVQTYQRRYLWQIAFEIVEHDALDALPPLEEADFFAEMEQAATYDALKAIYAKAYKKARAAGDKDQMDKLSSTYQQLKDRFTKTEAAAPEQETAEAA